MASFAQVDDLQNFTGQVIPTAQAQQALNQATGLIQGWTKQILFEVVADTVTVDPLSDMSVRLPEMPVTAVQQVQWLDDKYGTGWNVIPSSQYRFKDWGALYIVPNAGFTPVRWPQDLDTIQVTYTHGYNQIPQPIQDVCVALAARLLINPYKLQSNKTGGVSVTYMATRGSELLDTEQAALAGYSVYGMV